MKLFFRNFINFLSFIIKNLSIILAYTSKILLSVTTSLDQATILDSLKLEITKIENAYKNKALYFYIDNKYTNLSIENDLLKVLFNTLMSSQRFLDFGFKKIIIVTIVFNKDDDTEEYNLHPNILMSNNTTFAEYLDVVEKFVRKFLDLNNYSLGDIVGFKVTVWKAETPNIKQTLKTPEKTPFGNKSLGKRNYSTSARVNMPNSLSFIVLDVFSSIHLLFNSYKFDFIYNSIIDNERKYNESKRRIRDRNKEYKTLNSITPLKPKKYIEFSDPKVFATLDIETMNIGKGVQFPVLISLKTDFDDGLIFKLDKDLFDKNPKGSEIKLWQELYNYLTKIEFRGVIFVHNLGGFDGVYIYRALFKIFKNNIKGVSSIIDDSNKFITIKYSNSNLENEKNQINITFKDSYRIFPVSLDNLCDIYKIDGKLSKYNAKFNSFEMFNVNNKELFNEFINYSLQDSIALFNVLKSAQNQFINLHKVDICDVVSTSSLALKVFRTNFLKVNIPILKPNEDQFIRRSYFGGATDYYKAKAKNIILKYFDVNSLYPFAMLKPMPHEMIKRHNYYSINKIGLENFFGFIKVEVEASESIKIPTLPCRYKGKTIYPIGKWNEVYFSEELKAHTKLGYKFKLIEGYEFSKCDLFTAYVKFFYDIKMNSTGSVRYIAKLMLNTLYGIFGRNREQLESITIKIDDLENYVKTHTIKSIIQLDDDYVTLLIIKNLDNNILKCLNTTFNSNFNSKPSIKTPVKSNVAIASAVTSYARIHMLYFKTNFNVFYSDTDSIFIEGNLPKEMIGSELGLMKDELNGCVIDEAIFLGIKQYGYSYTDKTGKKVEKSVFAGVQRNSLSIKDLDALLKGKTFEKTVENRFYKSLNNLSITIKSSTITVKSNKDKYLLDNCYLPLKVNIISNNPLSIIKDLLNIKVKYYIKKVNKYLNSSQ